jgi:hypothetical protein
MVPGVSERFSRRISFQVELIPFRFDSAASQMRKTLCDVNDMQLQLILLEYTPLRLGVAINQRLRLLPIVDRKEISTKYFA